MTSFWLTSRGKYFCFDEHQHFLAPDHNFGSETNGYKKGVVVHAPKPRPPFDTEIKG
jgi:hypothetical protein